MSQSTQCLFLSRIPNSFPLLPLYPFLTSPCSQASTGILGFQEEFLDWKLPSEILPSPERNAKTSSCSGRQTGWIWIIWGDLTWQFYNEFKSRSKEPLPFWPKSVPLEFTCLQSCTSTAVPSFPLPEESTHLLWHRLLELSGSLGHCHWVGTGIENTPLPHVPVRKHHIPVPAEGSWMRQAHTQPQQTRSTGRTCQGYYKGSTAEHFHGGPVLYLNWIKLPGNTRAECKAMCILWVNHMPHCRKGIKGLK